MAWGRKSCLGWAEMTSLMFLVLFNDGGCRVSPRFYHFVSVVNQENKEAEWVQDFLAWPQGWKDSPWIFCELLKIENLLWKWFVEMRAVCNCRLI